MTTNLKRFNLSLLLAALLLAALLAGLHSPLARAAGISVNTANDSNTDGDGDCSLREAIINANNNDQSATDCDTGSGADTITFDGNYTITLASALPDLTGNLTIDGSGRSITVSGNNAVRVFTIEAGAVVTMSQLSIINGRDSSDGGGIYNDGTLTVNNSTFSGNSVGYYGGGIESRGMLTVNNSTFSDNSALDGSGIDNRNGSATVNNSTFSGNSATTTGSSGGGITNRSGTLTVNNSTFNGNTADYGGGIANRSGLVTVNNSTFNGNSADYGGGIRNSSGTLTVNNSTLSGNLADVGFGGGIYNDGTLTVNNSTLSGNSADVGSGGGILNNGPLHLRNSLIANSSAGGDCYSTVAIATNLNNLIEDGSCSPALSGDPLLGSLTNNGGSTQTFALSPDSPAIDAGDNATCLATDQRGVIRPQRVRCDIGAYELDVDPTVVVEQASGQADPTNASPINFTATFSEPINTTTFTATDVTLGGTAPGTLSALITQIAPDDTTTFNIAVSGMTGSGTVTASIVAGTVEDLAGNSNSASTSTDNSVTYDTSSVVYLPLIFNGGSPPAPDLVVDNLSATGSQVTVTLRNQGNAPVVDAFWVDVYLNPATAPSGVNQPWPDLGSQGLVWGVEGAALPLDPGQSLTLTVGDAYYWPDWSSFNTPLPAGSSVYAQADSVNALTTYGGVLETHEINGGAYNNISGPVSSLAGGPAPSAAGGSPVSTASSGLPPRE